MRRFIVCATVSLLAVLPLRAADADKANTLTPKESADGWLLLFDGENSFGWNNAAKWTIFNGMLAPQAENTLPLVTTSAFGDFELSLEFITKNDSKVKVLLRSDASGKSAGTEYDVTLPNYGASDWWRMTVRMIGSKPPRPEFRTGNRAAAFAPSSKEPQKEEQMRGHIALAGNGVIFRNVKLKPLNTKPLFNGKDLTGWKEFPGRKSKFTVTKEGWLNIKDGPGDLQTEGDWADFVLQLDCISNGKNLNSGVFFRCRPNEYQQGYEAQIHNGFNEQSPKEYLLEVYDPKTNELKEKKKASYSALDYGTGAIYRRQPARRQVAKDHEWFTMTVVANGRHMSVWVNGIHVTDWTDHRPRKDNARNGCRLERGPISLQGHDPTTDLSFRNFRIADLARPPEKK